MSTNRLHPLSAVTTALQRGFVGGSMLFFLVSISSGFVAAVDISWAFALSALGFLVGTAYGVAYYYRFEYELTDDTFDIASGVLSRRDREIPLGRVQNVDIRQGVVSRILGIAVVTIETAGGGASEATLDFVDDGEADRLQREIRRLTMSSDRAARRRREGRPTAGERFGDEPAGDRLGEVSTDGEHSGIDGAGARRPSEAAADPDATGMGTAAEPTDRSLGRPKQLFELEMRELILYSFASFRPAAVAALGFLTLFGTDFIVDYLVAVTDSVTQQAPSDVAGSSRGILLGTISVLHAVVVTYALSIAYTFASYYGFRLGRAGNDLVYERGLLQRYSGSIPLGKVQSVTITDNPIQRLLGYAGLVVETAGYGPDSDSGSQSAVPFAKRPRAHGFAERLTSVEPPTFDRPTTVARRRYLVRYTLVATVVVGALYGLALVTAFDAWYVGLVTYLAVPPAAHLRWANLGYAVGDEHLIIREGFWSRKTTVIPYYRIQTISTRRSIFQRRLGLASVVVDTASSRTFAWSNPTIYDVDLPIARDVTETGRDRLQASLARDDASLSSDSL
ncbi:putative membrane protein [Halovivax ruber XH-70]|uniref:Putative membrane protein n=1 Tax=Halovivax ruber (strain DSM 18193 / JCM 13892 / XH-70) TaxID=797302 RepID=L0I8Q7_HALRX|nr:PH domain-containing protein [Halovivax ruber]AGB15980.1 putative membrane protein [Halovivax ruber XH-70]